MPIFRRTDEAPRPAEGAPAEPALDDSAQRLRAEADPDPIVEEATDRLRTALSRLEARDEWGRPLPWRAVARIALGPVLTELRDARTAEALTTAVAGRRQDPADTSPDLPSGSLGLTIDLTGTVPSVDLFAAPTPAPLPAPILSPAAPAEAAEPRPAGGDERQPAEYDGTGWPF